MVTGRERSHLPTPIFSRNSFNGFKSSGRQAPFQHRAAATALPPKQLTSSGTVNTKPKAMDTTWQKPPSKSSLRSGGYSILTLLLLEEMFCWGCLLFMFTPSPLAKTQCHLLDMQVPRKACFGQVCNGEPGGLSRLKRQKLLKEFKSIWREFIIISGYFQNGLFSRGRSASISAQWRTTFKLHVGKKKVKLSFTNSAASVYSKIKNLEMLKYKLICCLLILDRNH